MAQWKREGRTAAISALASGVGLISGRQTAAFFAQFGGASWLGIAVSSILYGAFCALVGRLAKATGARSFSAAIARSLGRGWGRILGALYGLILLLAGLVMLAGCFRMAELTLYAQNAGWMGAILSLCLALTLNMKGIRAWSAGSVLLCGAFYLILAADPRQIQYRRNYETVAALWGSLPGAALSGALYAGLSASLAAGAVAEGGGGRPLKTALESAAGMLMLLSAANCAMARGGMRILSQPAPDALLAARWGAAGFYGCALLKWICCTATLAHVLRAILGIGKR